MVGRLVAPTMEEESAELSAGGSEGGGHNSATTTTTADPRIEGTNVGSHFEPF